MTSTADNLASLAAQPVIRAHKIELRPTPEQVVVFKKCCGVMRFVYNQLVERAQTVKYSRKEFQKFCSGLRTQTGWMRDVTSRACYEAMDNFHCAMTAFFKSCKGHRKGKKVNLPKFKKKGVKDSFQLSHESQFSAVGRTLFIQKLGSPILMREKLRFAGAVKAVTIKFRGGKWFAIFRVELPQHTSLSQEATREPSVGIDFGLKSFAVLSTGEAVENPRLLATKQKLLCRRQRQISRKTKESKRREVAKTRVARLHRKVCDQRDAFQHRFVNSVVSRFNRIVIEDLSISRMLKNRRLSSAISDASWTSVRAKLAYKCRAYGVELLVANRFFPSSKTCSKCGKVKETLNLNERTFCCEICGHTVARDLNAARNLNNYVPTPPIIGSRKTRMEDLCKTSANCEAESFDCANTNPLTMEAVNVS